jgi:hypothetical protein
LISGEETCGTIRGRAIIRIIRKKMIELIYGENSHRCIKSNSGSSESEASWHILQRSCMAKVKYNGKNIVARPVLHTHSV